MKKILVLSLVFSPDGVSTSTLISSLVKSLSDHGFQITVLTSTPHYNLDPEAVAEQPLQKRCFGLYYTSDFHGISVYHISAGKKNTNLFVRLFGYVKFHIVSTVLGLMHPENYDFIFTLSPPLSIGISAWLLGAFRRIPYIYNVQEIYPDIAVNLGIIRNKFLIRFLEKVELFVYRHAEKVTVISKNFKDNLLNKGVPENKLAYIPNFVDTEFIKPVSKRNEFSVKHHLDERFVALYAGNLGMTQDIKTIIDAAETLSEHRRLKFLIIGGGEKADWLRNQIRRKNIKNIIFLKYQPRSRLPDIYGAADVCLIPMKREVSWGTHPSKVYTIMAAGKPILVGVEEDTQLARTVEEATCGWRIDPEESSQLANAILYGEAHPNELKQMGENGRNFVTRFHTQSRIVRQYVQLFKNINE